MGCGGSSSAAGAVGGGGKRGGSPGSPKPLQPYLEVVEGVIFNERLLDFSRGKRNVTTWLPDRPGSDEEPVKYKALVLLSHGLHEHANRHYPIARVLARNGYAVAGIDHLGHGLSEGRKGLIRDWNVLSLDFIDFGKAMQTEFPGIPTLILAHSMGTLVVLTSAAEIPNVRAAVISATPIFVGPAAGSPFGIKALHPLTQTSAIESFASVLASVDPTGPCAPIDAQAITSDLAEQAIHQSDERMYHKQIMNVTAYELTKMTKFIKASIANFTIPFLAIHGTDDQIALLRGTQFLYDNAGTSPENKRMQVFEGLRHELFHEKDPHRNTVMQLIVDYFDSVITSSNEVASTNQTEQEVTRI